MATLTFTISDPQWQRVINAYTALFGYSATLPDGSANPETADAFTRRILKEDVRTTVFNWELKQLQLQTAPPPPITVTTS